jgi:hypothetical protein
VPRLGRAAGEWLASRRDGSCGDGSGGGGAPRCPRPVEENRYGGCHQRGPNRDQGDLPAGHAANYDNAGGGRDDRRPGRDIRRRQGSEGSGRVRAERQHGAGEPSQDADDPADVVNAVHDGLLRCCLVSAGVRGVGLPRGSSARMMPHPSAGRGPQASARDHEGMADACPRRHRAALG